MRIWDVREGRCLRTLHGHTDNDHTVKLWHIEQRSSAHAFKTFSRGAGQVWSVAFSFDGSMLASGDDEGTIVVWDIQTGISLHTLRSERPYERMNIQAVKGLTEAQKTFLKALGATEEAVKLKSISYRLPKWNGAGPQDENVDASLFP